MNLNSRLFDRIRIQPAEEPEAKVEDKRCDHPGCRRAGLHRAPKGRDRDREFWFYCLDHVRAYNASYNYFKGMDDDAVSAWQKDALTGHRPTWTMDQNAAPAGGRRRARAGGRFEDLGFADPLGTMGLGGFDPRRKRRPVEEAPTIGNAARKAYDTLGVDPQTPSATIAVRYKELVKRLHPDANGGDRSREPQLQEVIRAWKTLKAAKLV